MTWRPSKEQIERAAEALYWPTNATKANIRKVAELALLAAGPAPAAPASGPEWTSLRAANRARQAEWDGDNQITPTYRATELAGELGEACNVVKKLERERLGIRGSRATVPQLAEELADIVICADLLAMGYDIDLNAAIRDKFNATSAKVGLTTRLENPSTQQVPA